MMTIQTWMILKPFRKDFVSSSFECEHASFEGTFRAHARTPSWFCAGFSCGRRARACVSPLTGLWTIPASSDAPHSEKQRGETTQLRLEVTERGKPFADVMSVCYHGCEAALKPTRVLSEPPVSPGMNPPVSSSHTQLQESPRPRSRFSSPGPAVWGHTPPVRCYVITHKSTNNL